MALKHLDYLMRWGVLVQGRKHVSSQARCTFSYTIYDRMCSMSKNPRQYLQIVAALSINS